MLKKYTITCTACHNKYIVKYGTIDKENCYEVYSCQNCKNLFSLKNKENLICPQCKNPSLRKYNPHKKENLEFYQKMSKDNYLTYSDFEELKKYWSHICDRECPNCGKYALIWEEQNE